MKKQEEAIPCTKEKCKGLEYIGKSLFKGIQIEPVSNFFPHYIIGKKWMIPSPGKRKSNFQALLLGV